MEIDGPHHASVVHEHVESREIVRDLDVESVDVLHPAYVAANRLQFGNLDLGLGKLGHVSSRDDDGVF